MSRGRLAILAAVVVVAAAGYWWMNRPPGPYKPDNSGLYPINVNGKYGFMDRAGKTVITPQFDQSFLGFSESLAAVQVGTKWGYVDTKGVVAITPQFDAALPFRYGRARVKLGNRWGFIDKDGKYIGSPNFLWATEFSGEFAPVQTSDRVFALVDRSGKIALLDKVDQFQYGFTEGLMAAASSGKWGFIDAAGKWVVDPQFEVAGPFEEGLAPVRVGGRWGYIDKNGKFVINPQYDSPEEFHDGYAAFGSGGKFGFIDTSGRMVVDAKFLEAYFFSDGLAPVKTEDGWGFIDRTGKMVISPQFDSAGVFQNGLALVTALGKEAYITTAGAFVVNPFPGTTVRAEKSRIAAEAAQAAANATTANRLRVAQGLAGEWVGTFGAHAKAGLTITSDGGVVGAVLLTDGWREVFRGELLDDNKLLLTGTSATRVGSSSFGTYNLDTVHLELSADGDFLTGQLRDLVHQARQADIDPELIRRNPGLATAKIFAAANPDADVVSTNENAGTITIRDRKTGRVVTMTFDEAKAGQFRFSAQGENGGAAAGNTGLVTMKRSRP